MFDTCFFSFFCFCSGIHHLARVGSTFHRLFALDHISIIIYSANRHLLIQEEICFRTAFFFNENLEERLYQIYMQKTMKRKHKKKAILFLRCLQIQLSNRKSNGIDLDIFEDKKKNEVRTDMFSDYD